MQIFYQFSPNTPTPYNEWQALGSDDLFNECYAEYVKKFKKRDEWPFHQLEILHEFSSSIDTPYYFRYFLDKVAYNQIFLSWQSYVSNDKTILEITDGGLIQYTLPHEASPLIDSRKLVLDLAQKHLDKLPSDLIDAINLMADFQIFMLFGSRLSQTDFQEFFEEEPFFQQLNCPALFGTIKTTDFKIPQIKLIVAERDDAGNLKINFNFPKARLCRLRHEREQTLEKLILNSKVMGYSLGHHGYCHFDEPTLNAFHQQAQKAGLGAKIGNINFKSMGLNLNGYAWRLIFGQTYLGDKAKFDEVYDQLVQDLSKPTQIEHYLHFAEHFNPLVHLIKRNSDSKTNLHRDIFRRILESGDPREIRVFTSLFNAQKPEEQIKNQQIVENIEKEIDEEKMNNISRMVACAVEFDYTKKPGPYKNSTLANRSKKKKKPWAPQPKKTTTVAKTSDIDPEKKREKDERRRIHQQREADAKARKAKAQREQQNRKAKKENETGAKLVEVAETSSPLGNEGTIVEFQGTVLTPVQLQDDWDIYKKQLGEPQKTKRQKNGLTQTFKSVVVNGPELVKSIFMGRPPKIIGSFSKDGVNFKNAVRYLIANQTNLKNELTVRREINTLNAKIMCDSDHQWKSYQKLLADFKLLAEHYRDIMEVLVREKSDFAIETFINTYNEQLAQIEATEAWPIYYEFSMQHLAWLNSQDHEALEELSKMVTDSNYQLDKKKAERIAFFQGVDPRLYMISQSELFANLSILGRQIKVVEFCLGELQNQYAILSNIYQDHINSNHSAVN
jgi:hypothetical protein